MRYFNSIKVQLEHALLGDVSASGNVFQFHKGTIRTCNNPVPVVGRQFQFHKGTIRTTYDDDNLPLFSIFQFHKGTIRTYNGAFCHSLKSISIP